LLVLLPWLMERREVAVAEVAAKFGLSEAEVVRDLELASMCGLPPFVDEMIDLYIDEGMIHVGVPRLFIRPLRITAPEGFALLAAARAARQITGVDEGVDGGAGEQGDSALDRALAKLSAVLGGEGVVVDTPAPPLAAELRDAILACARLRMTYWSAHSDRTSEREITPRLVFVDRGRWYLIADDGASGEQRTFRIDRIESLAPTGTTDEPREVQAPSATGWFEGADAPLVVLRVPTGGAWVAERYPVTAVTAEGEGWRIELPVVSERWLRELLLRLGQGAVVEAPAEWIDLGREAASELLTRYDASRA
jgi:proteasome accessory factor C